MSRRGLTPPDPSIPGPDPRECRIQRTGWSVTRAAVVVVALMVIAIAAWAWRIHPDYQRRCGLVMVIDAWQCGALLWPIWWPRIVRGTLYGAACGAAIVVVFRMLGLDKFPEALARRVQSGFQAAARRPQEDADERENRG